MTVSYEQRRELAAKVRDVMGELATVKLDGVPLADLIAPSEAEEWVEEHGGLESVEGRLMPEGCEWPRFEDGEPVRIGDEFAERIYGEPCRVGHFAINKHAFLIFDDDDVNDCEAIDHGTHKRVKRPAPKVLDADGEEICVGDTVWWTRNYTGTFRVESITLSGKCVIKDDDPGEPCGMTVPPEQLTHRAPVLAADGKPLREGETVWRASQDMGQLEFVEYKKPWAYVKDGQGKTFGLWPDDLTHERPESWERLEEDCGMVASEYAEEHGLTKDGDGWGVPMRRDLVRRARALAERGM